MTINRLLPTQGGAPIARAVAAGPIIYCTTISDDAAGNVVPGDAREQSARAFANLERTLGELDATLADVVHVTVYVTDMADRAAMNEVWAETFGANPPARATIGVAALADPDLRVEVSAQAFRQGYSG